MSEPTNQKKGGPGAASGKNLDYQTLACEVIKQLALQGLVPYKDNGVDVGIELGGTDWSFDVFLKDANGDIVVAECKRWESSPKQGNLAEFAYKTELLRKTLGKKIAAFFFAKTKPQIGALKVAAYEGIEVVELGEEAQLDALRLTYHQYDASREEAARIEYIGFRDEIKTTDSLTITLRDKDGNVVQIIKA